MTRNNLIALVVIILIATIGIGYFFFPTSRNTSQTGKSATTSNPVFPTERPSQTITITDAGFSPKSITVKSGVVVTFMNTSKNTISVNSNDHPTHMKYPALNLGTVDSGKSLQAVFDVNGTYQYHNHLKAEQTGEIVVK